MPSERYWSDEVEGNQHKRPDQKFYTAISLLGIAIINFLTGHRLSDPFPSAWGNVSYYYSMVYCVRVLLFLAVGDFPTSHTGLANALCVQNQTSLRGSKIKYHYKYDWLTQFLSQDDRNKYGINSTTLISNQLVTERLSSLTSEEFDLSLLKKIGRKLDSARLTRNIENYDSLIAFHHVDHDRVTEIVNNLREELRKSAKILLVKTILTFAKSVLNNPRRSYYLPFLNQHIQLTGEDAIRKNITVYKLSEYYPEIEQVFSEHGLIDNSYPDFHHGAVYLNIRRSAFGQKDKLMTDFEDKVNAFSRVGLDFVDDD